MCHFFLLLNTIALGFPGSLDGKRSACNAGDPSLIPGLGRSPGEGIGHPHQYSRAFLVARMVKNLPAMQETWVRSLGWDDSLEKEKATHSSILAWRIPWTTIHGVAKSWIWLSNFLILWVLHELVFLSVPWFLSIKMKIMIASTW